MQQFFLFRHQTNNYQAVLVTNGTASYVLFTYNCEEMGWSGDMWGNYATIGYSVEGEYYANNLFSNLKEAIKVACLNTLDTNWSNVLLSLPVFLNEAEIMKQSCNAMISEDVFNYGNSLIISSIAGSLEPCPCNQRQARNDWRFRPDDDVSVVGLLCYFQRFPSPDNASQYCCYSR